MSWGISRKAIAFLLRIQMWLQLRFFHSSFPTELLQLSCPLKIAKYCVSWQEHTETPALPLLWHSKKTSSLSPCFLKCKEKSFTFCLLGLQNYLFSVFTEIQKFLFRYSWSQSHFQYILKLQEEIFNTENDSR